MTTDWQAAVNDQNQALANFSFCQAQHGSKYFLDSKENTPALYLLIMRHTQAICF
jgi:virulence-associated protein VapD